MKKVCGLVCMMWVAGAAQAQEDYHPFPTSNAEWRVIAYNGLKYHETLYEPHNRFAYRMIEYDTLIEGTIYSSIMPIWVDDKLGYCAFREENKRVYVYLPECGEHLLYDFNLEVGDTIFYTVSAVGDIDKGMYYGCNGTHYQVLVSTDSFELNTGEKRRRLHLSGGGGNYGGNWIEGIGDMGNLGVFNPFVNRYTWGGDSFAFTCFSQNQESVYISPRCKNCDCKESPNNVINIISLGISIFPNPTTGQLRITNYELSIKQVELYSIVGNLIQTVNVDTDEIEIDMENLQSGVYFVKVITDKEVITKKIVKH